MSRPGSDPSRRWDAGRAANSLAAPALGLLAAAAVAALGLLAAGADVGAAVRSATSAVLQPVAVVEVLETTAPLYLAGVAVALGLRAGLVNLGVDGQYRLAALAAAAVAGAVPAPGPVLLVLVVAVGAAVGAAWAGVAALLKVTRGVHEVITTVLLTYVASGVVTYLLGRYLQEPAGVDGLPVLTVPDAIRLPSVTGLLGAAGLDVPGGTRLSAAVLVAAAVGVAYALVLRRTRVGFDLRALGLSMTAAAAGGVDARRTVVLALLGSGAAAGVVGLALLLGGSSAYSADVPVGYGVAGVGVALLGRSSPLGMALAALVFAVLDRAGQALPEGAPRDVVPVVLGTLVLVAVGAAAVTDRRQARREAEAVARERLRTEHEQAGPRDDEVHV